MQVINKKIIVIFICLSIFIFGICKLFDKEKVVLDNVVLDLRDTNNSFAIYIEEYDTEGNASYIESEDSTFPTEAYVYNKTLSGCLDSNSNEVEDALKYDYVSKELNLRVNKPVTCYVYFDKQEEKEFSYTGSYEEFIVPKSGEYQIELWGASGGSTETGAIGGNGAYTKGIIELKKQDKLYIFVGEEGHHYTPQIDYILSETFNGGGIGKQHPWTAATSGGGATDVRLEISETGNWDDFDSLKSRIMVAAGGGGAFWWNDLGNVNGGFGGALNGGNGEIKYVSIEEPDNRVLANPIGGTQTSGGIPNDNKTEESFGKFGIGGNYIINDTRTRAGGGSGYYGGGGGVDEGMTEFSGAGGSSFISGYQGCIAIDASSTEGNITHKVGCNNETQDITCSYHYSGKVFTDTVMFAGNEEMPTYNGEDTMIGNTGNGHAKIKLIVGG